MNPAAVGDPSTYGRGLDSPTNFFKVYDHHDPFGMEPSNGNGYGGVGANGGANGGSHHFVTSKGQENVDAASAAVAFGYGSPTMPPSPFNHQAYQFAAAGTPQGNGSVSNGGGGSNGANGGYSVATPNSAGGAGGATIPPSPSSVVSNGPMFSPNPMPDSTTNFQHQTAAFAASKQQNGFSLPGGPAVTNGDRRASVDTILFDHDIKPSLTSSYFEPLRSNSVDYSSYSRFVDAKQEPNFGGSEAGASNGGNGVAQSQKAFVPCKVCGDKASGYHYGVTSCEGCKGFFRRSIQKQIEYRCLRDGKCMVYRLNRNRCQYCRFKKCLAVGMSRDSVRYGRVPKRSRERMQDDARVSSQSEMEADSELEKKQLALYDIILSVSQAHHSNCAYTDDKIKNLAQKPIHFPLENILRNEADPMLVVGSNSTELLEQQKVIMWQTMAQYTMPEIQHVVEFAKRIPNFTDLMQDDQLVLIKAGFFEVWLVRISRMFSPQHMTVMFFDGCFVTRDQMEMIYNADLVNAMFAFSVSFNNLHLNDGEIGLFTAVVLLTPDRPGLSDPRMVEQQQEKLIEALKLQLSRSHSSDPQVFPNLLLKLSELRSVGAKHNEVLSWYRMNWRLLKLPPLYAEIYDIPKDDEQLQQQQQAAAAAAAVAIQQHQQHQQQQQQQQSNGMNGHSTNGHHHNHPHHSQRTNGNGLAPIGVGAGGLLMGAPMGGMIPGGNLPFNGLPLSPYGGADIKVPVSALQHLPPQMAATNGGP